MDRCPNCGYTENTNQKVMNNVMSEYVLDVASKPGDNKAEVHSVINSAEPYIIVPANPSKGTKEFKLRRKDYVPTVETVKPSEPIKK